MRRHDSPPSFSIVSLAFLTLAVAGYSIAARDAFAVGVAFISYGILLALIWVAFLRSTSR